MVIVITYTLTVWLLIGIYFLGFDENSLCIGLARVGTNFQKIVACSLQKMADFDLGGPLHSLIVCSPTLHALEEEYIQQFKI